MTLSKIMGGTIVQMIGTYDDGRPAVINWDHRAFDHFAQEFGRGLTFPFRVDHQLEDGDSPQHVELVEGTA